MNGLLMVLSFFFSDVFIYFRSFKLENKIEMLIKKMRESKEFK